MVKVLHLLSDPKFADIHISRFNDPRFQNRFIFLGDSLTYTGLQLHQLEWVIPFSDAFDRLKKDAGAYQLLVVYHLDYIKACFVNEIAPGLPVAWHMYGTELYNNYAPFKYNIYSDATKIITGINSRSIGLARCKRVLSRIKNALLRRRADYDELQLAIRRINYFAWYSKEEYDFLQAGLHFGLPPFLQLPVLVKESASGNHAVPAKKVLWLGNSASPENNHTDIITLLHNTACTLPVLVPFSYGGNNEYGSIIKKQAAAAGLTVEWLSHFTGYDSFCDMLGSCQLAVFNSYRQMGLGNIFIALKAGVKVYLNERNPSFTWLVKNEFHLYSIQQHLLKDIQNNELALPPEQAAQNRAAYDKLVSVQNNRLFLDGLVEILTEGRRQ